MQFPTLSNSFRQVPDNKVSDNKVALHLLRSKLSLGHNTFLILLTVLSYQKEATGKETSH